MILPPPAREKLSGANGRSRLRRAATAVLGVWAALVVVLPAYALRADLPHLGESYQFLVSDRTTHGGALYTATAGALKGKTLPLSFVDSPAYWGAYVCAQPGVSCTVRDIYDPADYTLAPEPGAAGDLQTERVNVHNGTNIYDAAVWQIAVVLGQVAHSFSNPAGLDAYALAGHQNLLLKHSHGGSEKFPVAGTYRAVSAGHRFLYNGRTVTVPEQAYAFRMLARGWLSSDPLAHSPYAALIRAEGLPGDPEYRTGKVSWSDWKPITGENAWAFLLGPLQAAYIHYVRGQKRPCIPFEDPAIQNALAILPTFAVMQSRIGAVYYAPWGTIANQGTAPVHPYEVSLENNFSLYAGLKVLQATLEAQRSAPGELNSGARTSIARALGIIQAMVHGGRPGDHPVTEGMLSFFKNHAWRDGVFVAGGSAVDPGQPTAWTPSLEPKAVDATTWGIAALGARQVDEWFGFGAAYHSWQQVKRWGAYGAGTTLWGVGYSNQDGNGLTEQGAFGQGILSAEWTAGAITMVRAMIRHYQAIPADSAHRSSPRNFVQDLQKDESQMLAGVQKLRLDIYPAVAFPGQPANYSELIASASKPYLYASRRRPIPFGWYANPLPSTCATAWVILIASEYDPFGYGGRPN